MTLPPPWQPRSGRLRSLPPSQGAKKAHAFDTNPLYAVAHESIYCNGGEVASDWAAERALRDFNDQNGGVFDAAKALSESDTAKIYFTGEMVFPFMFDEFARLRSRGGWFLSARACRVWTGRRGRHLDAAVDHLRLLQRARAKRAGRSARSASRRTRPDARSLRAATLPCAWLAAANRPLARFAACP